MVWLGPQYHSLMCILVDCHNSPLSADVLVFMVILVHSISCDIDQPETSIFLLCSRGRQNLISPNGMMMYLPCFGFPSLRGDWTLFFVNWKVLLSPVSSVLRKIFFMCNSDILPSKEEKSKTPPMFLCIKVGKPMRKSFATHTAAMVQQYGKRRKQPEYWFAVPRERWVWAKTEHLFISEILIASWVFKFNLKILNFIPE